MTTDPLPTADADLVARALADAFGHGDVEGAMSVAFIASDGYTSVRGASPQEAAETVVKALAAAGRLLPEPLETREEIEVRWHTDDDDDDAICMKQRHIGSMREAREVGRSRIGRYGIGRYSVWRRTHWIFADQSSWTGSWVAVDPDTKIVKED